MLAFLDPKVWLAVALAWALGSATGYGYRAFHSVSNSTHDKTVAELATLKQGIKDQEALDAHNAVIVTSRVAAAEVRAKAAEVIRENADNRANQLLLANHDLLQRQLLPGIVRDAYNGPAKAVDTANPQATGSPGGQGAPASINLFDYSTVCTSNKNALDLQAAEYDELLGIAHSYYDALTVKAPQ